MRRCARSGGPSGKTDRNKKVLPRREFSRQLHNRRQITVTVVEAIIEGIIQGATEFLPVSSSGHLSLSKHFLGISVDSLLFDVMLHVGTLVAVLAVYYKVVLRLIVAFGLLVKDLVTGQFRWSRMNEDRRLLIMLIIALIPLFLLFLPVPGTGMKVKDFADVFATDNDIVLEGCALIVTSILLTLGILASRRSQGAHLVMRKKYEHNGREAFRVSDAIAVGVTQCIAAVFPGVSRSGSTLSVGLMRGVDRQAALDFSFVLGIPSILAASVLTVKDAIHENVAVEAAPLIAGMVTAAVVGFLAIKLLRWMVTTNKLHVFAWYTLILGIVSVVVGVIEHTTGVNVFTGAAITFS